MILVGDKLLDSLGQYGLPGLLLAVSIIFAWRVGKWGAENLWPQITAWVNQWLAHMIESDNKRDAQTTRIEQQIIANEHNAVTRYGVLVEKMVSLAEQNRHALRNEITQAVAIVSKRVDELEEILERGEGDLDLRRIPATGEHVRRQKP